MSNRNTNSWNKKRTTKAQVTFFLIVAVLLLLVFVMMNVLQKPKLTAEKTGEQAQLQIPGKAQPVKVFVDKCIEQMMLPGIEMLALQGGYLYLPNNTLQTQYATVAYWYEGKLKIPTILGMENQLKQYAEEAVPQCLQNLSVFKQQWNQIDIGNFTARVTIANETVLFLFGYPITLTDRNGQYRLENFSLQVPVRLGFLHDTLEKGVRRFSERQPWVDLTMLSRQKVSASMIPIDEGHFLLMMTDNSTIVKDRQLQFFAAVSFVPNKPPTIVGSGTVHATEEEVFEGNWSAIDESPETVQFTDDTVLFDIKPDGYLKFTPHVPGTFDVTLTATDTQGRFDQKKVTFIVDAK